MNEPMSATIFSENQIRLADEHYQRGNLKEAIEIVNALTFGYPNTSVNHRKISQALVAYEIHWRNLQDNRTHYDILRISSPFCSRQMIQREYTDLVVKLCPDRNNSIAAKSAFDIINIAWMILSDPERRRDYNIEQGFENHHCIEIICDSNSDSD